MGGGANQGMGGNSKEYGMYAVKSSTHDLHDTYPVQRPQQFDEVNDTYITIQMQTICTKYKTVWNVTNTQCHRSSRRLEHNSVGDRGDINIIYMYISNMHDESGIN